MDIPRKDLVRKRRIRRIVYACATVLALAAATYGVAQLEPAAPTVEKSTVFTDTVTRGSLLRKVRGLGTLVPEEIVVIPARDEGIVTKRRLLPGSAVQPDTILVELSNPQLEQELFDAESELQAAEADYANLKVTLESEHLNQEATVSQVASEYRQAKAQYDADKLLAEEGLTDKVTLTKARVAAEQLEERTGIERKRLGIREGAVRAQLAAQQARIDQARRLVELRTEQRDRLKVRAGIQGVLQQLEVEIGQLVTPGAVLARVSDPRRLKAALKIPETQVKDILLGQEAEIDTRNGVIPGTVIRIDPAVIEGTRTVDVELTADLPPGAVPDLSVDGTVLVERIDDAIQVGRPVYAQPDSMISLFRLDADGQHAVRVRVEVGKTSVNRIVIRQGLRPGDRVILSDMSAWDSYDRIRLI